MVFRRFELGSRLVTNGTGFLSVRQAAAGRSIRSTATGADNRAFQIIDLASLRQEVTRGCAARMANAARGNSGCRGDVVRPDPDVRSLVGANRSGRRASHIIASLYMAGVTVCGALRIGDMREIAATVRLERSTRRMNRVNHIAEVVAFIGTGEYREYVYRARAVRLRVALAHRRITVMADQAELGIAFAIRTVLH